MHLQGSRQVGALPSRPDHSLSSHHRGPRGILWTPIISTIVSKMRLFHRSRWRDIHEDRMTDDTSSVSHRTYETTSSERAWLRRYYFRRAMKVIIFPWGISTFAWHSIRWSKWYRKKLENDCLKPPKVKGRKRALSIPLEQPRLPIRKRKTASQERCKLTSLPAELRLQIWEEYIGLGETYLLLKDGQLTSFRIADETDMESYDWRRKSIQHDVSEDRSLEMRRPKRSSLDILPLLQTCRLMQVPTRLFGVQP